eukprot:1494-Heterococcus_DN1.PRE.2
MRANAATVSPRTVAIVRCSNAREAVAHSSGSMQLLELHYMTLHVICTAACSDVQPYSSVY